MPVAALANAESLISQADAHSHQPLRAEPSRADEMASPHFFNSIFWYLRPESHFSIRLPQVSVLIRQFP